MGASLKAGVVFALAVILGVTNYANGQLLSSLPKSLIVSATRDGGFNLSGTEVHSGIDTITVTWKLNSTLAPGVDAAYKKVRTKLCFASKSQVLRAWRKSDDNLSKDKTCPYDISLAAYTATGGSANYTIPKATPGASYFVRAFAIDATGTKVAFGQTSDKNRTANTFIVIPITGRHASIDIAVAIMSAFSVVSLFTFYFVEKYYLARKKAV